MIQSIDINKLAMLSRLTLSEPEAVQAKERLQEMLKLMENLKELDLKNVEPMVAEAASSLREDTEFPGLSYEQAFVNAPQEENHHFTIPKVI
ncbi:MAG: Asp-tRNA(Asn)/Glu-tRNA(Gln) amidotransferase subunit GatC [Fibromonadaceae bacterium]|jgi:aspartyl-tRNA(Asn)/glutamyl-tRNA(Gln) amidotransferase subunit C|nr:Asp-tRNA(Asn)/Glu-tRNA(Gln) amidotransferase subunit GatC [Fibromonadales bacterium]MDR2582326.1 Asp-tRNA(Asn)/Glu-tRNA(Gln) amidotransferase subunit GatC [Fibromonadaceae bacterium]